MNWLIGITQRIRKPKEVSIQKKVIKQSVPEKRIFYENYRFYYTLSDGRIREITATLIAGVISLVIGIIWAIARSTVLPLFLVPLLGLGLGYLIDLAIEEEREKKKRM